MLKSCSYCGRIHDSKYICPAKAQKQKERQSYRREENKKIYAFHRSQKWKDKSISIRQRDKYCCQICIRKRHNYIRQYEADNISVHHIDSVSENWDRRLDDYNLISLCQYHHEMAEKGDITKDELFKIAEEQENVET